MNWRLVGTRDCARAERLRQFDADEEEWRRRLPSRAGGFTLWDVRGGSVNAAGDLIREPGSMFQVTDDSAAPFTAAQLGAKVNSLFGQDFAYVVRLHAGACFIQ